MSRLAVYALHHDFSSQVLAVPFISAYLLHIEKRRIFWATRYAPLIGIPAILAGLGIGWWAQLGFNRTASMDWLSISAVSVVIVWSGLFVLAYGPAAAKSAAFPLAFLLLMIPPPEFLLNRTIRLLQDGSTEISVLLFRAVGLPVFRQGFVVAVPGVRIEVAQECSSIRSSIALLITSLLAGHLYLRKGWKTAVLVVLALPLSVIKNGIRISTLVLLSLYVNPGFLHGRLHRDGGFVFFLIALALLYPAFRALEKSERRAKAPLPPRTAGLQKGTAQL